MIGLVVATVVSVVVVAVLVVVASKKNDVCEVNSVLASCATAGVVPSVVVAIVVGEFVSVSPVRLVTRRVLPMVLLLCRITRYTVKSSVEWFGASQNLLKTVQ